MCVLPEFSALICSVNFPCSRDQRLDMPSKAWRSSRFHISLGLPWELNPDLLGGRSVLYPLSYGCYCDIDLNIQYLILERYIVIRRYILRYLTPADSCRGKYLTFAQVSRLYRLKVNELSKKSSVLEFNDILEIYIILKF